MRTITLMTTLIFASVPIGVPRASAGMTPEQSCQTQRAKAAGKYAACIQAGIANYYSIANATGDVFVRFNAGLGKCVTKYAAVYGKLQAKALASPSAETCDAPRYVDGGNGTVTDNLTALQWEKKTDDASVHDWQDVYSWASVDTAADGTAFTSFVPAVNAEALGGQRDWRLPTIAELLSITQPSYGLCTTAPCIDAVFGLTASDGYWSATPYQANAFYAWGVHFGVGLPPGGIKPDAFYVRAVRGGF